jgi:hypothetical protein
MARGARAREDFSMTAAAGLNYDAMSAFNAARHHRQHGGHHSNRNYEPEHTVAPPGPQKSDTMIVRAGLWGTKKLVGTMTAGFLGFWDTYWGMTAIGADKDGKGGVGLDLIWSALSNIWDLANNLRSKGPIGGRWLGAGVSGTSDASWYMWFGKQLQMYGATKKGGAEANVGEAVNYGQRDDAGAGNASLGAGGVPAAASTAAPQEHVIFDPLAGFR